MRIRNEHFKAYREGKLDEIPAPILEMLKEKYPKQEKKPVKKVEEKKAD